jgi:hypothetical protein
MADENTDTAGAGTSGGDGKNTASTTGSGTQSTDKTNAGGAKVSFTEDQQEAIDRIIERRIAKAKRAWARERLEADADGDDEDEGAQRQQRGKKPATAAAATGDSKSDAEKQVEELTRQLRERDSKDAFVKAAAVPEINANDPDVLFELLKGKIEYDDKGAPKNIADVLKAAQTTYPKQFGKPSTTKTPAKKPSANAGATDEKPVKEFISPTDRMRSAYAESSK